MAGSLATQAALATLEKGLNKLLHLDSSNLAIEQLAELEGKVIAIQSTLPSQTFFIIPTDNGLFLTDNCDFTVDSKLTASAPLLIQLLLTKDKQLFLKNSDLMIVGEASLLYQFFKIFDEINPDWQHELSQWFGPAIAGLAVQSVKLGNEQLQLGLSILQTQFTTFVEKMTSLNLDEVKVAQNPVANILDLLQKKFGQS
ncbi:ubiquinone biosynthesis accessory factor UbiJ [Entomomonas asaccharolytica]|uniref:SCP2 domain-containing protein n=1 Tax=Entomomonas asaccharolytica TaxID=2785331 RepID=A0A974NEP2_9GAMM|nr:SCP2 sterol-binding domain-containing protein [Entomomonas asaccharolytica]QQP85229.1 SCP2 domain-containing protein [Entomomonas asaccharolytica]